MVEKITKWKMKIISLFRGGYLKTFHVREMAKLLDTTHVTLLPHLESLTEDRVLTSKVIGRNRVFALNLDNILAKDHVAIAEKFEANEYLEKTLLMRKVYSEIFRLGLDGSIILFGSYVKGYKTQASDIDLFYLGEIGKGQTVAMEKTGELYGKQINVKKARLEVFEAGLRKGDTPIREILEDHLVFAESGPVCERFVEVLR